jgi:hypothetical protein
MLPWLNSNSAAVQAVASVLNFLALLASVVVTGFLVVYTRKYVRYTRKYVRQTQGLIDAGKKTRTERRHELASLVRQISNTLNDLPVYTSDPSGWDWLRKKMLESRGFSWVDFESFGSLAAEADEATAQRAQMLKRELSWLNARIGQVQSNPSGFEKPICSGYEWNTAFMGSQEALKEMLKTTGAAEEVRRPPL